VVVGVFRKAEDAYPSSGAADCFTVRRGPQIDFHQKRRAYIATNESMLSTNHLSLICVLLLSSVVPGLWAVDPGRTFVWNEGGASLDFSIAPAWFQTKAFLVLCILGGVFLAWALYRLRVQQIRKSLSARFDERLVERTRMARELHDTFLQTLQGSKLVADDALEKSSDPVQMRRAMEQLSVWLEQAIDEGRAALNSLRTSTTPKNDLAEAFKRASEECRMQGPIDVFFSVTGEAREMHPVVRDEIYRVGYEAIRNACAHSRGSRLEVGLKYGRDLAVLVKDNGVGIDPIVAEQGKDGRFGLQGMRERVARIGGKLTVASSLDSGTEVKVVVPGGIVFRKPSPSPLEKVKAVLRRVDPTSHSD